MQTISAFILTYIKYGDNDAVVHCFTNENGYEAFFIKGIYSKGNKKKPYLFPLNEIIFNVSQKKSGSMRTILKIEKCSSFDVYDDFKSNAIIFFLAEFFNAVLRNEEKSEEIYDYLRVLKNEIDGRNYQCHINFLVQFLQFQGCSPLMEEGDYLNVEEGSFSNIQDRKLFSSDISKIWREILNSTDPYRCKIPSSLRKEMMESVIQYYDIHVPHFKLPDSLSVLQQLFDD